MVFRGDLLTRTIHKFKTEYLLIWQKYLSTWTSIKYFGHQVQVSTKYFWISKGQLQVSTKYSIICTKYQVQVLYLTPTLDTVKCHYNACHYNANASLRCDQYLAPKLRLHALMTISKWLSTWAKGVKSSWSDRPKPMTPLCFHTNGIKLVMSIQSIHYWSASRRVGS